MTRVLVVSSEPVGERMAGPAIRALELARAISESCDVTLAAPAPSEAPVPLLEAGLADFDALLEGCRSHDVVVAQALPAQLLRHLRRLPARYVADLYNPLMIEVLEALDGAPDDRGTARLASLGVLAQCATADFVICASEKQRDLWLGAMAIAGLVDVEAYRVDPTYRSFIDVVPFGLPDEAPSRGRPALKGVWPGIGEEDEVLLWGGGVWPWLDALTPIRAVERLREQGRPAHLVFMGVERPGLEPGSGPTSAAEAVAFARDRGLEGSCVHFHHDWVPYAERQDWLLDADLGLSAHTDHLEARFSFRTRVLDYIWAGLPVVTSRGDSIAELVEGLGVGRTVDPGDADGFAAACAELLEDRERLPATAAEGLRWSKAARPLVDYCVNHRERPVPRKDRAVIALSTYGQYPSIAGYLKNRQGPGEVMRRLGRLLSRAVRHR